MSTCRLFTISRRPYRLHSTKQHSASSDKLLDAAAGSGPYFITGLQRLNKPLTIFFRDAEASQGQPGSSAGGTEPISSGSGGTRKLGCLELGTGPIGQDEVEALLKVAQPSGFGRNSESVLDLSYRNALELRRGNFALDTELPTVEMLSDISDLMQPDAPQIFAQLHKINIYGPGGMFKEHVDTPVSNAQFGSLVVALPCAFEGGELVIRHAGQTATLPLGGGAAGTAEEAAGASDASNAAAASPSATAGPASHDHGAPRGPLLHFAAFFSDCRHEVLPVRSGYRITLTYNLLLRPSAAAAGPPPPAGAPLLSTVRPLAAGGGSCPLAAQLHRLLGRKSWQPHGATLGFVLGHRYAASLTELNDGMFPRGLKGADRLLYTAVCQELGLEGRVVPIHLAENRFWLSREKSPDILSHVYVGRSFDEDGVDVAAFYLYDCEPADEFESHGFSRAADTDIVWVGLSRERLQEAFQTEQEVMTYGNDPHTTTVYSGAALLVEVPPWGSPERAAALARGQAAAASIATVAASAAAAPAEAQEQAGSA